MKKLAVLTAVVFLFGFAGFAAADDHGSQDPAVQANGADIVGGGGTNANDGGTAVAVKDNLNGNTLGSNNTETETETKTVTVTKNDASTNTKTETEESFNTKNVTVNKTEDSFNKSTEESFNKITSVEAEKGSQAANNGGTNVKQEAFIIKNELPGSGDSIDARSTTTTTTDSHATGTGSTGNNSIGSGSAGAVYVGEDANYQEAGAQYKSNNNIADDGSQQVVGTGSNVKASAEEGGIASVNNTGAITLDKSTTITISDIGLAIQKTELEGKVEDNKLIVGGPKAVSVTKGGEGEAGKAESDDAKSGKAVSVAKSKSGSGAFAGASGGSDPKDHNGGFPTFGRNDENEDSAAGATADADSDSKSKATGGSAATGAANSTATNNGIGTGGAATSEAVTAYTNFTTGNNNFTTGSFNGIGGFNVNSGVGSLNQSMINVNAVVGGGIAK